MSVQLHLIIDLGVVDHVGADIVAAHLRSVLLHTIKQMESEIIYKVVTEILFLYLPGAQSTGLRNPVGIRTPAKFI